MTHSTPAVVVGLDSMQGIQTARILAGHGIPVVAVARDPLHHACKTRVCDRIVLAHQGADTVSTLEDLAAELGERTVLVPCTDGHVRAISRARERLVPHYHLALPAAETVEMLMDKVAFHQYGERAGLPVPDTRFLRSRSDAEAAAGLMPFPCAMKPPFRSESWIRHTSLKAFRVETQEQLLELYDEYSPFTDALILQRWIEGDESELYSVNCYYGKSGQPLVTFVARKLRQWPPGTGQSSLGVECRNDHLLDETLRLFDGVDYRGLGYVEFKRDVPTDTFYIVEPNIGRPTGRSAIAEAGGVPLLYTMYCDLLSLPLPEPRSQTYGGAKWIHLRRDTQAALHRWWRGELTIRQWRASIKGKKGYALFSWRDPRPFFADLVGLLAKLVSPKERKRRGIG